MDKLTKKEMAEYMKKAATGLNEATDADGGYLVTKEIMDEVLNQSYYQSVVANKCKKFETNVGGTGVQVPYCNSPLATESTGVRAYFVTEAAQKTVSNPTLGQLDLEFSKLVVRVPVTDELRADTSLLYDVVVNQGAGAIAYRVDREILLGTDSTISGVLTGDGANGTTYVNVASAGGTVTSDELTLFIEALNPQARKNATWFVNSEVYSDIANMNDLFISWDEGDLYCYGMPVEVAPQLTTFSAYSTAAEYPTHMILGDFSKYVLVNRPITIKESSDFRFDYDESEIRMVLRIAGGMGGDTMTLDDAKEYGWVVAPQYEL